MNEIMKILLLITLYVSGFIAAFFKGRYALSVINERYGDDGDDGSDLLLLTCLMSWIGFCAVSVFIITGLNDD